MGKYVSLVHVNVHLDGDVQRISSTMLSKSLKNRTSAVRRPKTTLGLLGTYRLTPKQSATKNGLLWKMFGFFIFVSISTGIHTIWPVSASATG